MSGVEYLYAVMAIGAAFAGLTGCVALLRKRNAFTGLLDAAERDGLWLSLELCVFAVVFALLPFPLFYLGRTEAFAWRLSSMMLAIFFGLESWRAVQRARKHGARWPVLLTFLLTMTGLMVVAEAANAVLWSSLGVYTGGLLWIVTLCGIQFIAIVAYERQSGFSHSAGDWPNMRMRGRMRSGDGTGHPNSAANGYVNINPDTPTPRQLGRDPNRYTDQRSANGRTIANPAVRSDTNTFRR